jgi:hypothetical protein
MSRDDFDEQTLDHYEAVEYIRIADCEYCQRCTKANADHPNGICMAFNRAPAYVYDRCLSSLTFDPKGDFPKFYPNYSEL